MSLHLAIEYAQHLVGRQGQNCTSLLSQCNNEDRLKEMDMNCYFKGYLLTFLLFFFSPAVQLEIVQQISLTLSSQKQFELLFFISSLKSSNFILKIIGIYTHYNKSFNPRRIFNDVYKNHHKQTGSMTIYEFSSYICKYPIWALICAPFL